MNNTPETTKNYHDEGRVQIDNSESGIRSLLSKNPSLILGGLTIVVSLTTIIINYFYYVFYARYLNHWGFSSSYIKMPAFTGADVFFVVFGICFVFQCLNSLYISALSNHIRIRAKLKHERKELNQRTNNSIILNGTEGLTDETEINIVQTDIKKALESELLWIVIILIYAFILSFLFILILLQSFPSHIEIEENKKNLFILLAGSGLVPIVSFIELYSLIHIEERQKRKHKAKKNKRIESEKVRSIIDSVRTKKSNALLKELGRNTTAINMVFNYVSSIMVFFFVFIGVSSEVTNSNSFLGVTEIDSKTYAVIYQDDKRWFLKPVQIDDGIVTISKSMNRIIYADDVTYVKTEFDIVLIDDFSFDEKNSDTLLRIEDSSTLISLTSIMSNGIASWWFFDNQYLDLDRLRLARFGFDYRND